METGSVYPVFPTGTTNYDKKEKNAEFIRRKTHIKVAELVDELQKNIFLECIDEEFIMKLLHGVLRYDAVSMFYLLNHVFDNYAKIDDHLVLKNKKEFEEPQDLTRPIDVYFSKQ